MGGGERVDGGSPWGQERVSSGAGGWGGGEGSGRTPSPEGCALLPSWLAAGHLPREHVSRFRILGGLGRRGGDSPVLCPHPCSTWQADG